MIGDGGHAQQLRDEGCPQWAGLVAIGNNRRRKKVVLENPDVPWSLFWAGTSRKPADSLVRVANIMAGCQVMRGAFIAKSAAIGEHCIINHLAVVEHHARLADFVHVAPGAKVLGGAVIGEGALIGANAVVLPEAVVPAWAIIRACSVWPADYRIDYQGSNKAGGLALKFQPEL
jgi:acetyltransferase EpsM